MARSISAPVGKGKKNKADDVSRVQELLNTFTSLAGIRKLKVDGQYGPKTQAAIGTFQAKICRIKVDYVISPGKTTITKLLAGPTKIKAEAKAAEKAKTVAKKTAVQQAVKAAEKAAKSQKIEKSGWGDILEKIESYADELYDDVLSIFEKKTEATPEDAKKIAAQVVKKAQAKAAAEAKTAAQENKKSEPSADLKALYKKHVRNTVKTIPITKQRINAVLPHLQGTDILITSGFLNDADQFWKVNHHWDYLRWMLLHCLTLDVEAKTKTMLKAVLKNLEKSKPNPITGYRTGGIGQPEDKSSVQEIRVRWKILKQCKKDWLQIWKKTDVVQKSSRNIKCFKHPSSPIRPPGTSMHGTGYALDMIGNASDINAVCKYLGASLIYPEPGNWHIEFANTIPKKAPWGAKNKGS